MNDRYEIWPLFGLGDIHEVAVLVVLLALLGLRLLPATRRWAPRGNARPHRPPRPIAPSHQVRDDAQVLTHHS